MAKKAKATKKTKKGKCNILLFILCLVLGWLGIDKLVMGGKKAWKIALAKLLLMLCLVGEIWNIYDMVCALIGRYKLHPLK